MFPEIAGGRAAWFGNADAGNRAEIGPSPGTGANGCDCAKLAKVKTNTPTRNEMLSRCRLEHCSGPKLDCSGEERMAFALEDAEPYRGPD